MNRKALLLVLSSVAVFFSCATGAEASSRPAATELAAITERGRLLAGYDAAAWHATDAVLATHPKEGSSGRYIAHKTEAGWVVDFGKLNATGDKFLVVSEAVQAGDQYTVKSFDLARGDMGWNLAAAKGIDTAMRDFHGADRPYNVAVLPAEGGSLYVYLYPPRSRKGSIRWELTCVIESHRVEPRSPKSVSYIKASSSLLPRERT